MSKSPSRFARRLQGNCRPTAVTRLKVENGADVDVRNQQDAAFCAAYTCDMTTSKKHGLRSLMNVGPAMERDLNGLGIHSIAVLAEAEAGDLFQRLERQCRHRVDPCVYDTFRAIIHEARTGEKTPWFAWTEERKRRERSGELRLHVGLP
jgi:DNA transformation protein